MADKAGLDRAEEIMGVDAAAKQLGLSYRGTLKWVGRGRLRARRLGREWLIRRSDLDTFRSWWEERYARYQTGGGDPQQEGTNAT